MHELDELIFVHRGAPGAGKLLGGFSAAKNASAWHGRLRQGWPILLLTVEVLVEGKKVEWIVVKGEDRGEEDMR
ncbi:MAG: hypothetical protein L0331_00855 [Chloroflexi bacterium]|nr:hypothetical protein [Chloroflexota bacterium]MCI0645690.1 hypothetical protein [Chloroflexota bacterium]